MRQGNPFVLCQDVMPGGTPNCLGLARDRAPQITSETKEAAKTCRVITDKHLIYSGYTGWWGGNHKPRADRRGEKQQAEGRREIHQER